MKEMAQLEFRRIIGDSTNLLISLLNALAYQPVKEAELLLPISQGRLT